MILTKAWQFLKLTRPIFLMGGFMLYALGVAAAVYEGANFDLGRYLTGQILVTCIQLMTHYANEYYDQPGDNLNTRNRTWFSGGSGVLAEGTFPPEMALTAARLFAGLGLVMLVVAATQVPVILVLGLISFFGAWFYSAPPIALVSTGWGELSASLVVAFLVPLVAYTMQTGGTISPTILLISIPLVLVHLAMLIAFQIPDWNADQAVGKRTLAVRLGPASVSHLHNLALLAGFIVTLALVLSHSPGAQFSLLALPLAVWQAFRIRRYLPPTSESSPGPIPYIWLTLPAVGLFALFVALWLAGFILCC